jgi:LmbE family N-acetylglucosaminyl deacetylase
VLIGRATHAPRRVVVVAAHPDDEVLGAGALMRRLSRAGAAIDVIHITDGAPRDGREASRAGCRTVDEYAALRRQELSEALAAADIRVRQRIDLGIAGETAAHALVPITRAVEECLRAEHFDVVVCHAFEGGHPDHDAAAFAAHAAVARLDPATPPPLLVEYPSCHLHDGHMQTGCFTHGPSAASVVLTLTPSEVRAKRAARDSFRSQAHTIDAFGLTHEPYRPAPAYAFGIRPNGGRLLYERFQRGLTGADWERLASDAERALAPCSAR